MSRHPVSVIALACVVLLLSGCPKGSVDYNAAKKAEELKDWDTALIHYQKALQADPRNVEYKLKASRIRFEAGQFHVEQGLKLRQKGQLQLALAEFQKALVIDSSSPIAEQQIRLTLEAIAAQEAASSPAPTPPSREVPKLLANPPELQPLSRAPINLKITNDAKVVFETVGKLAGLSVIFDPDFPSRRIPVELNNVTLEQALDVISLESKAFWKAVTSNIILVVPDQVQKRRD